MSVINTAEGVSDELEARLLGITVANGYETDIGVTVRMGRAKLPSEDETPCIQVLEAEDVLDAAAGKQRTAQVKLVMSFVIDAWSACEANNPNRMAHKMIRDIKKAIFKGGNRTFDDKVVAVNYVGRDIGPRADGAGFVQARVEISVEYIEQLNVP